MRKNIFISLLVFFVAESVINGCYAQNKHYCDSLIKLIRSDKEDTIKVNHLNKLSWELKTGNPDTAAIIGATALNLSEKLNWKKGIATSLGAMGVFNYFRGNYSEALSYYSKALKVDEELILMKDPIGKTGKARRLGNIGTVYMEQGNYASALDFYFKALKMEEEIGNKARIATHNGNIGIVYWHTGNFGKGLNYMFKALKSVEELGDKYEIARNLCNIGTVYNDWARSPNTSPRECDSLCNKALDYFLKALTMDAALEDKRGIAVDFGNIGNVYFIKKDYKEALNYYSKSLEAGKVIGDNSRMSIQYGNMSSVYIIQKKYKEAEKCLFEALKLNKESGALHHEMSNEVNLAELYQAMGNYKLSLEHYKRSMVIKDTLFNEEKNKEATQHEMNYEFEKKQAAIKAEQDKKDAVTKIIIYSVSGGLFIMMIAVGFIYRGYRQKKKANVIIHEQKLLVEEKQKEIVDSIHYAKRIQKAHLPQEKYISKKLNELKDKAS